ALLHDNLAGIRQIKSFAREREEHARFNRASDQLRQATLVVMRTWAIYSPSMSMFEAIGALLVLGFGSHAVLTGSLQLGDLVAILMLTAFLYDPISRLHQLNQLVQAGRAAGERPAQVARSNRRGDAGKLSVQRIDSRKSFDGETNRH